MKKDEKNKSIFLIIGLTVLMFCITGATYAYFALTASNNDITGIVGGATLNLTVNKIIPTSATTNMIPQLESTLDEAISSTYNCVDGNNNVVCQVYQATVTNTGSTTSELTGTITFSNITNMPNLKWRRIESATSLGTYNSYPALTTESIFEEKKIFTPNQTETYYFVIWVNEIGNVQANTGTFRATINFNSSDGEGITSTIRGNEAVGGAKTIIDLYNDGSELTNVRIGGLDTKPSVTLNATRGLMLDNNGVYRYYGVNPNNYVTFNGEMWRIISVSNVRGGINDPAGSMRMKIIRDDRIGTYSYDSSDSTVNSGYGFNNWNTADINTLLNNLYYNRTTGTCYDGQNNASTSCDFTTTGLSADAKNYIEDALWNMGGASLWQNLYANDLYTFERGAKLYSCSTDSCGGVRTATWTGEVGLMHISDYMYATDLSVCTKVNYNEADATLDYRSSECKSNDWLYKSGYSQWTVSPYSGGASTVFNASLLVIANADRASNAYGVRPVVYLKSDVIIS